MSPPAPRIKSTGRRWFEATTIVGSKVAPGEPESSELLERVSTRSTGAEIGTDQMPPLATERVDAAGVELLRQWILALRR